MPDDVPVARILAALERAATYRRSLATGPGVNVVRLQNDIVPIRGRPVLRLNREGWAQIGSVVDGFVGCRSLEVWWHPATDQVKIARPPEDTPPPRPAHALYPSHPPMGGTDHTSFPPFIALRRYIFTFEGQDYTPEETERLTAELGSIEGWTWRPEPDAPSRS